MAEQSGVGGLGSPPVDDETAFKQSYQRQGFFSRMRGGSSSGPDAFGKAIDKLVGSGGSISRLQKALDNLSVKMERMAGGQGGNANGNGNARGYVGTNPASFTGGGYDPRAYHPGAPQTPATGSQVQIQGGGGTNPHGGFGTAVKYGLGLAAGVGYIYGSRGERSIEMAPATTSLQALGGYSYKDVNKMLGNRAMNYGTQGPMDTLGAASAAQYMAGTPLGNARTQATQKNISELALTNPGLSLTEAASVYSGLRNPMTNNMMFARGFPTYQGPGGSSPDFISTSRQLVQKYLSSMSPADQNNPEMIGRAFQPYGMARVGLQNVGMSDQGISAIANAYIGQLNYTKAGGKGNLFEGVDVTKPGGWKQWEKEARMAKYSNEVISSMRDQTSLESKNAMFFSQDQEKNIATMTGYLKNISNWTEKLARGLGDAKIGPLAGPVSSIANNPLINDILLYKLLKGGGGGGSGGLLSKLGIGAGGEAGALGGTSLLGAAGLGLGSGGAGFLASKAIQSKVHGSGGKALGVAGGAAAGATVGAGLGLLGGPFAELTVPVGAGIGAVVGGIGGLLGDPPAPGNGMGDANSDLERRSSTSASGVTGLQGPFKNTLVKMFNDNPRLTLNSGYRSPASQKALWDAAVAKYGSEAAASKWVAKPGGSMHQKGLAADIGPASEYGWLKANAGKYGLVNYKPEPWHWEPAGASNAGNRTNWGVESSPGVDALGSSSSTGAASQSTAAGGAPGGGAWRNATPTGVYGNALEGSGVTSTEAAASGFFGTRTLGGGGSGSTSPSASGSDSSGGSAGTAGDIGSGSNTAGPMPGSFTKNTMGSKLIDAKSLASMLKGAGFSTKVNPTWGHSPLVEWLAAAMGESGLHIDAIGDTQLQDGKWGPSIGLFQDRTVKAETGKGTARDIKRIWGNAVEQVKAAFEISGGGTNLGPWGGPNYPGHKVHINEAEGIAAGIGDPPGPNGGTGGGGGGSVSISARPITANFKLTVMNASQAEAERLAQYVYKRIKELDGQEQTRSR